MNSEVGTQFASADRSHALKVWKLDDYRQPVWSVESAHQDYIKDIKYAS